ncbi:MAG: uracil-DNA glycosylase [Phycisphaerae bacterium]|nr:uracil-DNA glycosylase [Phycisphaerae bacterium]
MKTRKQRVTEQLLQVDRFFVGDFTVRGPEVLATNLSANSEAKPSGSPLASSTGVQENEKRQVVESGLAQIVKRIAGCRKCELAATRTHTVPGEGNPRPRIAFVGEAPGEDEDRQGRPFVGRAGQLLDKIIAAMGLKRSEVFICNILKCRPPGNRDPKPEEVEQCSPYLQEQLELLGPEVIVALGSHAAKTLLDTHLAIGKLRGRFHDYYFSPMLPPIKLMPTYHPAYVLRNYTEETRKQVWEDMRLVLKELKLPVPPK